jgi:hypothetical protein
MAMSMAASMSPRVCVAVPAETGEGHREKADGPDGEGKRIKIHAGA